MKKKLFFLSCFLLSFSVFAETSRENFSDAVSTKVVPIKKIETYKNKKNKYSVFRIFLKNTAEPYIVYSLNESKVSAFYMLPESAFFSEENPALTFKEKLESNNATQTMKKKKAWIFAKKNKNQWEFYAQSDASYGSVSFEKIGQLFKIENQWNAHTFFSDEDVNLQQAYFVLSEIVKKSQKRLWEMCFPYAWVTSIACVVSGGYFLFRQIWRQQVEIVTLKENQQVAETEKAKKIAELKEKEEAANLLQKELNRTVDDLDNLKVTMATLKENQQVAETEKVKRIAEIKEKEESEALLKMEKTKLSHKVNDLNLIVSTLKETQNRAEMHIAEIAKLEEEKKEYLVAENNKLRFQLTENQKYINKLEESRGKIVDFQIKEAIEEGNRIAQLQIDTQQYHANVVQEHRFLIKERDEIERLAFDINQIKKDQESIAQARLEIEENTAHLTQRYSFVVEAEGRMRQLTKDSKTLEQLELENKALSSALKEKQEYIDELEIHIKETTRVLNLENEKYETKPKSYHDPSFTRDRRYSDPF